MSIMKKTTSSIVAVVAIAMFGLVATAGATTVAIPINLNLGIRTANTFQGVLAVASGYHANATATAANAVVSVNDFLGSSRMSVGVITTNTLQGALSSANGSYSNAGATLANAVVGLSTKSAGTTTSVSVATTNTGQLGLAFANGNYANASATAVNAVVSINIH